MKHKDASLPRNALLHYGFIAFPIAFAGMPLYVHAPDFYTTEFQLSLSSIGLALLFLRFIDAIQDPLIGRLSDRFSHKRLLIMLMAALVLVLSFTGLFQPILQQGTLVWFAFMMLLATTAFSTLSINLNTAGGLWTRDSHQKTRITAFREAFGLAGLLLAVLLPAILMQNMTKMDTFLWVSGVLVFLVVIGIITFLTWYRRYFDDQTTPSVHRKESILTSLKAISSYTRRFFIIYGISMLASSIPAVLVLFFIRDRLGAESHTGLFLALYFLSGAAGMPLWQFASRRWNKYHAWIMAMCLAVATFFWAYFLGNGDIWQYAVICVLSGIAFGADLALPPSILADHIHAGQQEQHASLQFGVFAFLAKTVLAVASAIVFPLLDWSGFQAGQINSREALWTLSLTYAAIPCAIKLTAAFMLWRMQPTQSGENHAQNTHPIADRSRHHV